MRIFQDDALPSSFPKKKTKILALDISISNENENNRKGIFFGKSLIKFFFDFKLSYFDVLLFNYG